VFLYYCTKSGLDLAIVNAEKLERFASIPAEERALAEELLFNTPPVNVPADHPEAEHLRAAPQDWARADSRAEVGRESVPYRCHREHFRGRMGRVKATKSELSLDARLSNYIVEGSKDGLVADLDLKLAEGMAPLDIINGPLMAGMSEVGAYSTITS
jgi:5-methyltetrahydrofolate--homocysteine methyltransferase